MLPETVRDLLDAARRKLATTGCDTPLLDARLLLQHASGISREDMILHPDHAVDAGTVKAFEAAITRRLAREPVARILGEREFYGRRFLVTPDVLDPRPDTETLIDAALKLQGPGARILDLGTGSGAIIVTLLAERPDETGLATDISPAACAVARANAVRLGVGARLQVAEGSWFEPVAGRFDLIVSNPPYIPRADIEGLAPDVRRYDPLIALVGGDDGLAAYRAIAADASSHLAEAGTVLVEIGADEADAVSAVFAAAGCQVVGRFTDLGGHVRCLSLRKA
jgi:release factor glutamine methyltransferase